MRLIQIDRIVEIGDNRLTAVKNLALSEHYLNDHFPRFPVMPGVLMVEALYQSSMFLVRKLDDFAHSMVALRETKNIKFGDFVEPGQQLLLTVTIKKQEQNLVTLAVKATVQDQVAVRGQMVVEKYNLADQQLAPLEVDKYLRHKFREKFHLLCGPNYVATGELDNFGAYVKT